MNPNRALKALILTASLLLSQAASAQDQPASAGGVWDQPYTGRGLLFWEELKGYRLFFHPEDTEPERRRLTLVLPTEEKIDAAWAIIRPLSPGADLADAWLRVEGEIKPEKVLIEWDGTYRGQPFPDGPYTFEIHMKWKPLKERTWKVVILKSLEYPQFAKINGVAVGKHPLIFRNGQFEPIEVSASFSAAQVKTVPIIARLFAPDLPEAFATAGILVQGRLIEDEDGIPVNGPWQCLCQQPLPAGSPARLVPKKVRCDWDLSDAEPGVWDLRLGLYHDVNSSHVPEPCDAPVLDEDRLRVAVKP
jgi:hypothetical protein